MGCYTGAWGGLGTVFPLYGPNAVTWPLVYDESVSVVQQIAYIMGAVNEIHEREDDWASDADLDALWQKVLADQAAQTTALEAFAVSHDNALRTELLAEISKIGKGMLVWDVTEGRYNESSVAMRNMYTWLSVHAVTVGELAQSAVVPTVADLAGHGLNVRGLATWSTELKDGWTEPAGIRYTEGD